MSANSFKVEFVEFKPGPKGTCKYADHKDAFILQSAQLDHVAGQGSGSGATFSPIWFHFEGTEVQQAAFAKLVGKADKTVNSLTYTSQIMITGKRKDKKTITYEGLDIVSVNGSPTAGEQAVMLSVQITYRKRKGKVTEYDAKGAVVASAPFEDDLDKGTST